MIAKMPVREGFGFESPSIAVAGSSKAAAARASPSVASKNGTSAKGKRRKTPEYTDSEDESE